MTIDYRPLLEAMKEQHDRLDCGIRALTELIDSGFLYASSEPASAPNSEAQTHKVCCTCRVEKTADAFYVKPSGRLVSECKVCAIARSSKWNQQHKHLKYKATRDGLRLMKTG